ncbi:DUF6683 family protein [Aquabacterium sp. OR-4]|uniref:DUF6683 family protein n=1 Tax=Aquabacterium sp. OR-4 TaxID=2978127 RepID=UPI0021B202D6|nr:DUF6683 family protein [Aquabacterium sp. OR-4]MDT7837983.1 hypothetical protein [Aquabacterium sp. OR-4]
MKRVSALIARGLLGAVAMAPALALANYPYIEFAQSYAAPMSNFISNSFLNQEAMINATRSGARPAAAVARLPLGPPRVAQSAAELAQAAPQGQREQLQKVYTRLMPVYQQIERKLGWPQDDLPGAVAAVVAGNYMVMSGTELSDAAVTAAGNQLRASAVMQTRLSELSTGDRRRLYEQCAMLGTFMAVAIKTLPQQQAHVASQLRQSARENLRAILGPAAETVRFTPQGLQMK